MATSLLQRIATLAAIAAIPVLTILVFAPLFIYVGNSGEFAASYFDFLLAILPYAAIIIIGFAMLGALLSGAQYRLCLAVVAALGLLTWLQGSILVWDYGALDGQDIDWFADAWRGVLDLTIWCVVLYAAITGYERFGRVLVLAAMATLGIQSFPVR